MCGSVTSCLAASPQILAEAALPEVAARFGIQSIPTMILFRGGKETRRLSGARPAGMIMADLSV